ncbi:MAG: ABC transporter substrate-binding protein [Acidobacteriota bacterium]
MAGSYWDKFTTQRVSRRRMLQTTGVAGAAAGAVWMVGCGGSSTKKDNTPTTSATSGAEPTKVTGVANPGGTPKSGGTYSVASTADFDTFDPYIGIAASVGYFPRLYNVLVNFSASDPDFRFDDLSTSFEQPDPQTYNFKIRPGVKVSPNALGVPEEDIDATDVVESYKRIISLPQSNAFAFIGKEMASQEASVDAMTYTMKTARPYAYFRNRIGSSINTIVPKEALTDENIGKLKQQAAGAGAFMLQNYTEGQGATLVRNPNYYRKDEKNGNAAVPYIETLQVQIIPDRSALRVAFQSGQLDSYGAPNLNEATQLQQGQNYTTVKDSTNTFIAFTMDPTKDPWKDDRVRQAAVYAIDRKEYIDRIYNGEAKANGLVHWSMGELALSEAELQQYQPYDPAKSRALIKAATGQDTVKIKVMWPADSDIEEHKQHLPIWQEQMKAAGFEIDPDPQPFATWLDNYTNLKYDASLSLNQVYETAEFNLDFQHSEGPARNGIYAIGVGKVHPEIDAEIDRTKTLANREEFVKAVKDLQKMIYDKGPSFIPIVTPYSFTLYNERVKNIPQGIGSSGLWVNTWYLES